MDEVDGGTATPNEKKAEIPLIFVSNVQNTAHQKTNSFVERGGVPGGRNLGKTKGGKGQRAIVRRNSPYQKLSDDCMWDCWHIKLVTEEAFLGLVECHQN